MIYYTVYKITNLLDGKFYIGKHKTKNLDDGYMGSGKRLKYAMKKHSIENFKKEILEVFSTEEEMNTAEARFVVLGPDSYNLCPGGQGGFGYINDNNLNTFGIDLANQARILKLKTDKEFRNAARKISSKNMKKSWAEGKFKHYD